MFLAPTFSDAIFHTLDRREKTLAKQPHCEGSKLPGLAVQENQGSPPHLHQLLGKTDRFFASICERRLKCLIAARLGAAPPGFEHPALRRLRAAKCKQ